MLSYSFELPCGSNRFDDDEDELQVPLPGPTNPFDATSPTRLRGNVELSAICVARFRGVFALARFVFGTFSFVAI